jgi:hypothetical protein
MEQLTSLLAVTIGSGITAAAAALQILLRQRKEKRQAAARAAVEADMVPSDLPPFDVSSIDFIELLTWNASRQLSPLRFETVQISKKPPQEWVDQLALEQVLERVKSRREYGAACSLASFSSNDPLSLSLELKVVRDSYAHYVAIREYLRDEQRMAQVRAYAQEHPVEQLIAHSPLSVIAVNVTVLAEGEILLMRRSNAVSTFRGYWQAGPHKSLGFRSDGRPESVFELAHRALKEEVGLEPEDYGHNIVFSWFGMYLREATPYFFAHISTPLSKQEVERRIVDATSAYETADGGQRVDWFPLTVDSVEIVTDTWRNDPNGEVDALGRRYLPHAAVSLRQMTRVLDLIAS